MLQTLSGGGSVIEVFREEAEALRWLGIGGDAAGSTDAEGVRLSVN